jgi:hypothetical protein
MLGCVVARCLDYPGVLAWIQQRRLNRNHFWVVRKIYQDRSSKLKITRDGRWLRSTLELTPLPLVEILQVDRSNTPL